MAKSNMKFVDFNSRSIPVWFVGGLYYVTFDDELVGKANAGQLYENAVPDTRWVSGSTPDIAIAAAVHKDSLVLASKITDALNKINQTLEALANLPR